MLKKIIAKPHLFFFGLIPVFILISIFKGKYQIGFNFNDNYFITDLKFWSAISAVFFGLIGLNYFALHWANKPAKKWLTIIHISLQILAFILVLTRNNWNWIGKQYSQEASLLNDHSSFVIFVSFIIFIISIFIHLINFFTSLFLKSE
ncbi:hypothetical protein MC378_02220 [Polaribacter sp. MSW13]|uniref:Uncharacterized protein n=1 Tax=Polaribacter marinus TaxID=2916838 RepID=A0A9X2AHW1_9FLAO|nr:hypothetical protein [Polaribacter marinus]MCI2227966.1 hypothetical protein [Polaribacter marinus]